MTDPKLIVSPLSRVVEENGDFVEIAFSRLGDSDWNLEIVTRDGMGVAFESDEAAFVEAFSAITNEGVRSFFDGAAESAPVRTADGSHGTLSKIPVTGNWNRAKKGAC